MDRGIQTQLAMAEALAAWRDWLAPVRLVRLEFLHRTLHPGLWPEFKGVVWRGAFGRSLENGSPAHSRLFSHHSAEPGAESSAAKWALRPPLDRRTWIGEGETMTWGVTLFGDAVELAPECIAAARNLGRHSSVGWHAGGARLEILQAGVRTPGRGLRPCSGSIDPIALPEILDLASGPAPAKCSGVMVELCSPLEITLVSRGHDLPVRRAPALALLLRSLKSRCRWTAGPAPRDMRADAFKPLELVACPPGAGSDVRPLKESERGGVDAGRWTRGLVGRCLYDGDDALRVLPWLRLAEWLQLGKGTHYGQGVLGVQPLRISSGPAVTDAGHAGVQGEP